MVDCDPMVTLAAILALLVAVTLLVFLVTRKRPL